MPNEHATNLRRTRANMLGTDDEEHYWQCHDAAKEIERLEAKLVEIKENGAAYMQAVDAMLAAAERDGLLKDKSPYAHAKATSDAVKHVFGTVN